jgi:hypothetical protein
MTTTKVNAAHLLRQAAELYAERNKTYGDNYKAHGAVMLAMFPEGVTLKTVEDHNRFGVLTMCVAKLTRYGVQFAAGGHLDSARDLSVYAAMLQELTG